VVWHQTVCPDINAPMSAPFSHQVNIFLIVIIREKYLLPTIPTLRYMMRISIDNDSCYACHEYTMSLFTLIVSNLVLCPRNSKEINTARPVAKYRMHCILYYFYNRLLHLCRQFNFEGCPIFDIAFNRDCSLMLCYYSMTYRKSKPGSALF